MTEHDENTSRIFPNCSKNVHSSVLNCKCCISSCSRTQWPIAYGMRSKKQLWLYMTSTHFSKKNSTFDHSVSVIPLSYHITNDHQLAEQLIWRGGCRFWAVGIFCKLAKLLAVFRWGTNPFCDFTELNSTRKTGEHPCWACGSRRAYLFDFTEIHNLGGYLIVELLILKVQHVQ